MNDKQDKRTTLLEFPTEFPIKALGRDHPEFHATVVSIVARHASFDTDRDVRVQRSSNGNFLSVTVSFEAHSQEQLDTIYQALHDHDLVLMVF